MARIWNPTEETVRTVIGGNHFEFKPGQFKNMQQHMADFIAMNRQETGLVVLPPEFDPMDEERFVEGYDKTPEGIQALKEAKERGISSLINFYQQMVYNNQVSLKKDWARKDPSNDPAKLCALDATPGELEAMRLVAKYQKKKLEGHDAKLKEVEKLMKEVGPVSN